MFLEVTGYEGEEWLFDATVEVDEKLNNKLYRCFKKPTFVFIPYHIHEKLNPKVKNTIKTLDTSMGDSGITVEKMLSEKILFIKFDDERYIEVLVDLASRYKNEDLQYLVIEEE